MLTKSKLKKGFFFFAAVYGVVIMIDILRPKGLSKGEEKLKEFFGVDESFLSSINPFS